MQTDHTSGFGGTRRFRAPGAFSSTTRRARTCLAVGAVMFLALYACLLPFDGVHRWLGGLANPIPLVVALALSIGAARRSRHVRWGWACVAGMVATWTIAELVYSYYALVLDREAPFPGVPDVLYYAGYASLAVGLSLLGRSERTTQDARAWLDAFAVVLLTAIPIGHFVMPGVVDGEEGWDVGMLAALSYPLFDLTLVSVLILLHYNRGRYDLPILLLIGATAMLVVTDLAFQMMVDGSVAAASVLDLGWTSAYFLIGGAALSAGGTSDVTALPTSAPRQDAPSLIDLSLPYALALPLAALATWAILRGSFSLDILLGGMGAMGLLAIRQWLTLAENRSLAAAAILRLQELEAARAEAQYLANHDGLTGLLNRRAWFTDQGRVDAVVMFDIDHFKQINDDLGHIAGDEVLCLVAGFLADSLAAFGKLARLGGEEFGAALVGDLPSIVACVEETVAKLRSTPQSLRGGASIKVSVSAGIAAAPGGMRTTALPVLHRRADEALYQAKRGGRARIVTWQTPTATAA